MVGVVVLFSTNRIHEGVRGNRVNVVTVRTKPCGGNPSSFPINGFIVVQPNCFSFTLRTGFFDTRHHQLSCEYVYGPTSRPGFNRYPEKKKKNLKVLAWLPQATRMDLGKSLLWRLVVPLLFWGSLAVVVLFIPRLPQEPDNLPLDAWSYYGSQAPFINQLVKYRNTILLLIVLCAVVSEIAVFIIEERKKKTK